MTGLLDQKLQSVDFDQAYAQLQEEFKEVLKEETRIILICFWLVFVLMSVLGYRYRILIHWMFDVELSGALLGLIVGGMSIVFFILYFALVGILYQDSMFKNYLEREMKKIQDVKYDNRENILKDEKYLTLVKVHRGLI